MKSGASEVNVGCFVAGTLVWTAGGLVPIEAVSAGDVVLAAADDGTSEAEWARVGTSYRRQVSVTVRLTLVGSNGQTGTVGTTTEHPFWRIGEGWVGAGSLGSGDRVWSAQGWLGVLDASRVDGTVFVYNLLVETDHSYFVGEQGAWVHNQNCPKAGTAGGVRAGKDMTKAGKREVWAENAADHADKNVCQNCGTDVEKPLQSQKGVTPPGNEGHVDHIIPKSKGGDGSSSNGQLLCRDCNLEKSDK